MLKATLKTLVVAACGTAVMASGSARAELIYLGTTDQLGQGLGNVATILSLEGQGQNTSPSAAIVANGAGQTILQGAQTQTPGGANNQLRTLGGSAITTGSEFRLVWNLNEPGTNGTVTLDHLSATFYDAAGNLLHSANLDTSTCPNVSCTFEEVAGGIGGAGHVFGLNAQEASDLNLFANFSAIRVGIGTESAFVALSGDDGGFETFNLAKEVGGVQPPPIPEPTSMLLLGTGLVGLGRSLFKRRSR